MLESKDKYAFRVASLYCNIKKEKGLDLTEVEKDISESKSGLIKIVKISNNIGYLRKNSERRGITYCFGKGLSLRIFMDNEEEFYYTSDIKRIEKNEFYTENSIYSYEFTELSIEECNKILYGDSYKYPSKDQLSNIMNLHPELTIEDIISLDLKNIDVT